MKAVCIKGTENSNDAQLTVFDISKNKIKVIHTNSNDGHYGYVFEIEATEEEIKVIKEFCDLIEMSSLIEKL